MPKTNKFMNAPQAIIEKIQLSDGREITIETGKLAKQAKEENITVCSFTGNAASHLAKLSDISFTYNDPHTLDDDVYYPNPFIGLCIIGFEELIRRYFEKYGID